MSGASVAPHGPTWIVPIADWVRVDAAMPINFVATLPIDHMPYTAREYFSGGKLACRVFKSKGKLKFNKSATTHLPG